MRPWSWSQVKTRPNRPLPLPTKCSVIAPPQGLRFFRPACRNSIRGLQRRGAGSPLANMRQSYFPSVQQTSAIWLARVITLASALTLTMALTLAMAIPVTRAFTPMGKRSLCRQGACRQRAFAIEVHAARACALSVPPDEAVRRDGAGKRFFSAK